MIKYRTTNEKWENKIEKIEIERETEKMVFYEGRKELKRSDYQSWFDTFDEAKQSLVEKAEGRVENCIYSLAAEKEKLSEVKELKNE